VPGNRRNRSLRCCSIPSSPSARLPRFVGAAGPNQLANAKLAWRRYRLRCSDQDAEWSPRYQSRVRSTASAARPGNVSHRFSQLPRNACRAPCSPSPPARRPSAVAADSRGKANPGPIPESLRKRSVEPRPHTFRRNDYRSRELGPVAESSPEGIRTLATAVRGRRPRPLDDGALGDKSELVSDALGYQDSNLD
jgi:hypothetical protein